MFVKSQNGRHGTVRHDNENYANENWWDKERKSVRHVPARFAQSLASLHYHANQLTMWGGLYRASKLRINSMKSRWTKKELELKDGRRIWEQWMLGGHWGRTKNDLHATEMTSTNSNYRYDSTTISARYKLMPHMILGTAYVDKLANEHFHQISKIWNQFIHNTNTHNCHMYRPSNQI